MTRTAILIGLLVASLALTSCGRRSNLRDLTPVGQTQTQPSATPSETQEPDGFSTEPERDNPAQPDPFSTGTDPTEPSSEL